MTGALTGMELIDFGQMVSAPYCAKLFSDYGADVIKVELPEGDAARKCGRPGEMPLEHGTFAADYFGTVAGSTWGLAAIYGC